MAIPIGVCPAELGSNTGETLPLLPAKATSRTTSGLARRKHASTSISSLIAECKGVLPVESMTEKISGP
eukprot:CAMPEP_0117058438 /NCGR_PEP_ID=MMETSP0472-20121206/40597_1 /TAXON_ID=693140 ORGANISM="Tiarina fusus, Strain LIS" /NCGR_SAMPLE_ID=MMETSP0472 /ASSEMBLY_ACC=CAM_ASM_000603 /LENGTH=68 /DNA_ID=CAMNT_0004775765 /DNA_START=280 /DNA_END=482 /DNA_ORIENTATION=+